MSKLRTSAQLAALTAAIVAIPASSASAAIITTPATCYVSSLATTPIPVNLGGLAASQRVNVKLIVGGNSAGSAFGIVADASGNAAGGINSWFTSFGTGVKKELDASLQIQDSLTSGVLAETPVKVAKQGISVEGRKGKRTWTVQGLKAVSGGASTYYAHYFKGTKYKGRQKLGNATGECGYLKTKKPLTPFRKLGAYNVAVTANKKYDAAQPKIEGRVVVTSLRR